MQPHYLRQLITLVMIGMALSITSTLAEGSMTVTLTLGDENNQPGTVEQLAFHCSDTIMAVLSGKWPIKSKHKLDAYWINPQGKQQEHSRQTFTSYGATRVWVWLRFLPGEQGLLDKLLMEDNTSLQEFAGQWRVDIYLDGKKLTSRSFTVTC